jgi:hypothetical protein
VALKVLTSLYCTLGALTLVVVVAGLTVRLPVALLLAWVASPAKLAPTAVA